MVDQMKNIGFRYATQSGISIAMNDLRVPEEKEGLLKDADQQIAEIEEQYNMGLITDDERYAQAVRYLARHDREGPGSDPEAPRRVRRRLHHGRQWRQG